ncbi:universal stress protein [Janibacter sp. GXQ6167]|uniref:universal stress protein n=1 Tax=Janibacter sp. GXQ6167 TaxID=3240791 RepID=UPI00352389C9
MSYLVAYSDTGAGRDALALGIRCAEAAGVDLDIVVVRTAERSTPPLDGYTRYVEAAADEWLEDARRRAEKILPPSRIRTHQRFGESTAEGLVDAARELGARAIMVGGARGGIKGRLNISSLARVLLHSSPVPIALAPRRLRKVTLHGVSRLSVAVKHAGPGPVASRGAEVAREMGCPLRLVTLIGPGDHEPAPDDPAAELGVAGEVEVTATFAEGETVVEALGTLTWEPEELLLVGSSRLAPRGQLFLGRTAGKILREVPIPIVVIPRESDDAPFAEGRSAGE